jgi:hypothetical protein
VTDAGHAGERLRVERTLKIGEFAFGAPALDPPADQGRDAGAVIAAILEPLERVEQQRGGRLTTENANDPAHG